jgi:hypothetical protein
MRSGSSRRVAYTGPTLEPAARCVSRRGCRRRQVHSGWNRPRRCRSYAVHEVCVHYVGTRRIDARSCKRLACKGPMQSITFRVGRPQSFAAWRKDYAPDEADFEAKAPEGSCTGAGNRRRVFVAGGRRIRSTQCAGGRHTVAEHRTGSRNHSQ